MLTEGQQAGAYSHRAALPPLLQFGLSPDDHFSAAWTRSQLPLPTQSPPILDDDLQFAAWATATWRGQLRAYRQKALGALRELKARWSGISKILVRHQSAAVSQVNFHKGCGFSRLATADQFMERYVLPLWTCERAPCGRVRPAIWDLPYSTF